MAKFKVGDTVQLKSGGPKMTITTVRGSGPDISYYCKWFNGKKLDHASFEEKILIAPEEGGKEEKKGK
jgi:uncharacterized protein YodC (DUF2158 family)